MSDPADEAAFEKWLSENHPASSNIHRAFVAGRASKGEPMPNQQLVPGRIVRYYPKAGAPGYPAIVTRTFGDASYANMTVFVDGINGAQDGFTPEECDRGQRLAFSVMHEETSTTGLLDSQPRWGWPPRD